MAATQLVYAIDPASGARNAGGAHSSTPTDSDATFRLDAPGIYLVTVIATFGGGSVTLQIAGPDGSSWLGVKNQNDTAVAFTAAGSLLAQLPAGQYKLALA